MNTNVHLQLNKKLEINERVKGTIAELIRQERCRRNWSIEYLGSLIGSKDALMKYESGILEPTRERSMKLAYIFKTGTKYFYDEYLDKTDNFKKVLENSLIKSGLSKRQFYLCLNISNRTFYRWMNGYVPTRKIFKKIKEFL